MSLKKLVNREIAYDLLLLKRVVGPVSIDTLSRSVNERTNQLGNQLIQVAVGEGNYLAPNRFEGND